MEIVKRDGSYAAYDAGKIYNAIYRAMRYGSGMVDEDVAQKVSS
jgi:ribonucleoside-triphosphate reductase